MAAIAYKYTGVPVTITITNKIKPECYKACDAGTPVQKTEMLYANVAKIPCLKWDYLFNSDGSFVIGTEADGVITKAPIGTTKSESNDYVVLAYQKFKNTDRKVPAYRTFNGKTLKAGDSVAFTTSNKDEIVFYEKVAVAFGATTTDGLNYTGGELDLTIAPAAGE